MDSGKPKATHSEGEGVGGDCAARKLSIWCNFLKITGGTHRPVQLWCLSSSQGPLPPSRYSPAQADIKQTVHTLIPKYTGLEAESQATWKILASSFVG
jgi:hypothetical protein